METVACSGRTKPAPPVISGRGRLTRCSHYIHVAPCSSALPWENTPYLPAPSVAPPHNFSSQSEEIRVKFDYLMSPKDISSKLKEHKPLLYLTSISRKVTLEIRRCFDSSDMRKKQNFCLEWSGAAGGTMTGCMGGDL